MDAANFVPGFLKMKQKPGCFVPIIDCVASPYITLLLASKCFIHCINYGATLTFFFPLFRPASNWIPNPATSPSTTKLPKMLKASGLKSFARSRICRWVTSLLVGYVYIVRHPFQSTCLSSMILNLSATAYSATNCV